ncbi:MAG: DivIVA domain-containing protein [Ruminococcaceae bacterium]|nr:DivIVA domain-containing protein [Oscillospiraceae bacterium]
MLTPQEIAEKKFDKVIMGGYDMAAVDAFLDTVEKDYGQIYKENIVLKNKMKVLVAKIEEYRTVDESMRKALLSAQGMASSIIEKAKAESADIEKLAQAKADEKLASYQERIAAEEMRLEEAKTGVQAFVERMLAMYEKEAAALRAFRESEFHAEAEAAPAMTPAAAPVAAEPAPAMTPAPEKPAAPAAAPSAVLPDTVPLPNIPPVPADPTPRRAEQNTRVFEADLSPNAELPNSVKRAQGDEEEVIMLTPKPRFEFKDLQFGENYDVGRKKKK